MKILLAIDSSAVSEAAVREAVSRPWPVGTIFCAMSVVDVWTLEETPSLMEPAEREAKRVVTSAADTLRHSGYDTFSKIPRGVPKQEIRNFAKTWNADLILIGSRGRSDIERLFLGSVAQAVLRTAPCSVEVVRARADTASHEGMRILLGTNGSQFSKEAACSVTHGSWPSGTQIKIISVHEFLVPEGSTAACSPYSIYSEPALTEVTEATRQLAENAYAETKSVIESAGLQVCDVSHGVPLGDPRSVLLDEASVWGADLIVVGSHGRHGLDRLLLGSVSEAVAMHAPCSVEVIRGKSTDGTSYSGSMSEAR